MRRWQTEKGFALPITIFLVALLTVMLAAAFTRASVDRRLADSSQATVHALELAQSGLQGFFGDTFTVAPTSGDSIRYNLAGGYAWVTPTLIRNPADSNLNRTYIVRSTGYLIEPTLGATPQAQRTVAQYAEWQEGELDTLIAGLLTLNGIRLDDPGSWAYITGTDACSTAPAVAGLRTPAGSLTGTRGSVGGTPPLDESGVASVIADSTKLNWPKLRSGNWNPDYTSFQPADASYPTQYINGDFTLTNSYGTGLLVVTGRFSTAGAWAQWNGIVLVGKDLHLDADFNYLFGTVVTGLDVQLGLSPVKTRNEKTSYIYHCSTYINNALAQFHGFVPITKAWVDNWATY